jgi:hypothetical protein
MATRRAQQVTPEDDAATPIPGTRIAIDNQPVATLDLSPGERVMELVAGMGDDEKTTVRLYRRTANSNALTWCQTYSANEFLAGDLEMIRTQWGAGDYEIRVYGSQGLASRETVSIAQRVNANPLPVPSQQNGELATMLKALADSQQQMIAALSQRPDPQQQMMQTIAMMREMREAMGVGAAIANPQPAPKSAIESITEMAGAIQALKSISGELNPPKDVDVDNPMAMLPGIIDIVKTAMQGRQTSGELPMIEPPISLAVADPALNPAQSTAELQNKVDTSEGDEEMQLVQMLMRNYIKQILKMIQAGKTPAEGGAFIYDKLPDAVLDALDTPDWFAQLCAFAPELAPHQQWLMEAKVEVDRLDAIEEPDRL